MSIHAIFPLLIFLSMSDKVFAQHVSLSLSPPLVELVIKPGKSVLIAYTVENNGDPIVLTSNALPFTPRGIGGGMLLKNTAGELIQFSLDNSDFTFREAQMISSGTKKQYLLRVRVPEGIPTGDYYYTFFLESSTGNITTGDTKARGKATIGSHLLITVTDTGNLDGSIEISNFNLLAEAVFRLPWNGVHLIESSMPLPVQLVVSNTGKNYTKPSGKITLTGNFGERADYELVPINVLSGSSRVVPATPSANLNCDKKDKSSLCTTPLSVVIRGFFIGNYTLSATVNHGSGTPNVYSSITFIALPLKLIAGFIVSVLLGIAVYKKATAE